MININTKELQELLKCTPVEQNIMLVGKHGIGKSKILTDYYTEQHIKIVTLFLGQMSDPGDLIGLPNKDEITGKTEFMPPYWFPVNNKPIVLFLDELNRARPEILQTVMDLALNRSLAGKKLPEGSIIVSAINNGEEYQLTDLDPALISRFNIYNFKPTNGEWLLWATKKGINKNIISFIEENSIYLDSDGNGKTDGELEKTPDRRAWEKVSEILPNLDLDNNSSRKIIAGIVGVKAAARFMESLSENRLLSGKDLMTNFNKNKTTLNNYNISQIAIVNENVCRYFETEKFKEKKEISKNLTLYLNWLHNYKSNEAMAHYISLLENSNYPKMNIFIITMIPNEYKKINQFIKKI